MTVALVTDSNAQLPEVLRAGFDVRVVALTVVVGGEPFHEGVDITPDEFYARLARGAGVTTAAPSPGEVLAVYEAAVADGASAIVSVHVGANTSATVNAATLAARAIDVPVEVVDTGSASFAIGCCVWAAAEARARGGGLAEVATAARSAASTVGNVFVVGGLDLARRGGRLGVGVDDKIGIPVLALVDGSMKVLTQVRDVQGAVAAMVEHVVATSNGAPQRVGVGDATTPHLADALDAALSSRPEVTELARYRIGPSVGAHTGPGTVGACFFPA